MQASNGFPWRKALDRRRYKTRLAGPGGLDGSFGFSHLGGDDGECGDDDNGDGGPADDGGALLQHGLEAQGRADSGDAKQDGRDDKAAQLRVLDKPEQAVKPDIAGMRESGRAREHGERHQNHVQPLQPFHAQAVQDGHDRQRLGADVKDIRIAEQREDQADHQQDRDQIARGLCQQLGAIEAEGGGNEDRDDGRRPIIDAEEALQELALTGEGKTAGAHHGHQKADIV